MEPQLPVLINFTAEEKPQIAQLTRRNRFMVQNLIEPIYPSSSEKQLEFFNKSVRLITNIRNVCEINSILIKINSFLELNKDIITRALELEYKINSGLLFKRHSLINKVNLFIIQNKEIIYNLIDVLIEVSKETKMYDPSETTGYY